MIKLDIFYFEKNLIDEKVRFLRLVHSLEVLWQLFHFIILVENVP